MLSSRRDQQDSPAFDEVNWKIVSRVLLYQAGNSKVSLPGKMAVLKHNRKSGHASSPVLSAATPKPSGPRGNPPSSEARLSIRLWTPTGDAPPAPALWEQESPAVCLVLDLIAASEGVLVNGKEEVLTASFPSFPAAILTARRLQWAMQGFCPAEPPQAASLAVLLYDALTPAEADSLQQAASGQILLTEAASKFLENLPGLLLQPATTEGLRELLWRDPEGKTARSLEDEILAQRGVGQDGQDESSLPAKTALVAASGSENLDADSPHDTSRWLLGGVALAALAVAFTVTLYYFHSPAASKDQKHTAYQPAPPPVALASQSQASQTNEPAPATQAPAPPVTQHKQSTSKPAMNGSKDVARPPVQEVEKPSAVKTQLPPTPAPRGNCDLDPSQYAGQIDQARKNLGRGRYADAQRQFGAVLACDPNNPNAREGLERARMDAREADGQPEN
jgi:hypothetical protein